jgi:hypothetical protein
MTAGALLAAFLSPAVPGFIGAPSFAAQPSEKQIPREQALAKINEHIGRIDLAAREMVARYDLKTAPATLSRAFQEKGVKSRVVLGYATSWGQNAVFTTWQNVKPYYEYHRLALVESADSIRSSRATSVPAEDLFYLDLGMNAWLQHEKSVRDLMLEYIGLRAGAASFMDQKQSVVAEKEQQPYSARGPYDQRIAALESQAKQQLDQAAGRGKKLEDIGDNLRLFSPITAKSRIAPPDTAVAAGGASQTKAAPSRVASAEKRVCEETKIENKATLALAPLREPPAIPDSRPVARVRGASKGK